MEIKEEYNKNGYLLRKYASKKLTDNKWVALYEQLDQLNGNKCVMYEVQIIRKIIVSQDFGNMKAGDVKFKYPSNEDWGKYGWSYETIKRATDKYNQIVSEQVP